MGRPTINIYLNDDMEWTDDGPKQLDGEDSEVWNGRRLALLKKSTSVQRVHRLDIEPGRVTIGDAEEPWKFSWVIQCVDHGAYAKVRSNMIQNYFNAQAVRRLLADIHQSTLKSSE